jgi:hypothetical protein
VARSDNAMFACPSEARSRSVRSGCSMLAVAAITSSFV